MRYGIVFLWALGFMLITCKVNKRAPAETVTGVMNSIQNAPGSKNSEGKVYQASRTRIHDLIHTRLDLKFSYAKQEVYGQATLTLKPYFYPSDMLMLDAKGFEILEVMLVDKTGRHETLKYEYDTRILSIELGKKYSAGETYTIFINYIARPSLLTATGSDAITDARGLYFINPDQTNKYLPRQIWSQGETEASSCWFPTLDAPNEKMTQEFYLTVNPDELTLSNGELMYSNFNADGTRTDCWKQELPHAPYLAMIAIGKFAVVKDTWRDSVEVNYYVDSLYKPYARAIFGNTPEMMEFFSHKLGVAYPWKKFSQVVVRNFVSGAMENTTAVVHGEFLQQDTRGLMDESYEDVVSHELFHHWFGDLVTCESWSNLPLNESFATYGEYLWREYKYGRNDADAHLAQDYRQYINESFVEKKHMIRYYVKKPDDMFDAHSYQKGGLILHMLRGYVGDEAFFKSLKVYLTKRKFNTAEIHDLRMAFEEVTGEDMNWFFNQWFFAKGHPELEMDYRWYGDSGFLEIGIDQVQDTSLSPLFNLPVQIAIYDKAGKVTEERIWVNGKKNVYHITLDKEPEMVLFDPHNYLVGVKKEFKSKAEWLTIFNKAPGYVNRMRALESITFDWTGDSMQMEVIASAMRDSLWTIRLAALDILFGAGREEIRQLLPALKGMAFSDAKAPVRKSALNCMRKLKDPSLYPMFLSATNDSSYQVMATGLDIVSDYSLDTAIMVAEVNKDTRSAYVRSTVAEILAKHGKGDYQSFFERAYESADWGTFFQYGAYLRRLNGVKLDKAIQYMNDCHGKLRKQGDELTKTMLHAAAFQLDAKQKETIEDNKLKASKLKTTDATRLIYEEEIRKAEVIRKQLAPIIIPD